MYPYLREDCDTATSKSENVTVVAQTNCREPFFAVSFGSLLLRASAKAPASRFSPGCPAQPLCCSAEKLYVLIGFSTASIDLTVKFWKRCKQVVNTWGSTISQAEKPSAFVSTLFLLPQSLEKIVLVAVK
jgi:hypothetical protein